jgi:hypothetical protein
MGSRQAGDAEGLTARGMARARASRMHSLAWSSRFPLRANPGCAPCGHLASGVAGVAVSPSLFRAAAPALNIGQAGGRPPIAEAAGWIRYSSRACGYWRAPRLRIRRVVPRARAVSGAQVSLGCRRASRRGSAICSDAGRHPHFARPTLERYHECALEPSCAMMSAEGTPGTIEEKVNAELVYVGTKEQAEKAESPVGLVFKTKTSKDRTYVELESCNHVAFTGPVTATGEEHGPGIQGVAGAVADITSGSPKFIQELAWTSPRITQFFYWEGGVVKAGHAGLEFYKGAYEQVGYAKVDARNAAREEIAFAVRG